MMFTGTVTGPNRSNTADAISNNQTTKYTINMPVKSKPTTAKKKRLSTSEENKKLKYQLRVTQAHVDKLIEKNGNLMQRMARMKKAKSKGK